MNRGAQANLQVKVKAVPCQYDFSCDKGTHYCEGGQFWGRTLMRVLTCTVWGLCEM